MKARTLSRFSLIFLFWVALYAWVTALSKGTPLAHDFFFLYQPLNHLISEMLQKGVMPLWNPYSHCGVPLLANMKEGIFYPPALLFRFFEITSGYRIFLFLHYFFAGLFAYLFAASCGFRKPAALLFSILYAFNGVLFFHIAYYNNFAGIVLLPLIFIFIRKSFIKASFLNCALLAAVLALHFFSGHPFPIYAAIIFGFCYSFFLFLQNKSPWPELPIKLFGKWALILGLFFCISAVQLFPFYEYAKISTRAEGIAFLNAMIFSEPPKQLLKMLITPLWSWTSFPLEGDITIVGFYIGIAVLLLSFRAMLASVNKVKWFWALCLTAAFILSFGIHMPGYKLFWHYFPGLKFLRMPGQWLFIAVFCFCALSALGIESIKRASFKLICVFLVLIELFLFAKKTPFGSARKEFFRKPEPGITALQQQGPFTRISHIKEGYGLGREQLNHPEDWYYARAVLLPNIFIPYHIRSASGYGVPDAVWKYDLYSFLSKNPALFQKWNTVSAAQWHLVYRPGDQRQLPSYINQQALPYSGTFSSARFFSNDSSLFEELQSERYRPEIDLLISSEQGANGLENSGAILGSDSKMIPQKVIPASENKFKINADPAKNYGWLYCAESFYPGWEAYVGQKKSRIWRANYAFRAVQLPQDKQEAVFIYVPRSFYWGTATTGTALLALFFLFSTLPKKIARLKKIPF